MIRRPLTCPICGDRWKMVLLESSLRLGPPIRACRACRGRFTTAEREWNDLDGMTRVGYFLQNLVIVVPILGLLVLAIVIAVFEDMVGSADGWEYFAWGLLFTGSIFILMSVWNVFAIVASKVRSSRERRGDASVRRSAGQSSVTVDGPTMPLPPPPQAAYPQGQPVGRGRDAV